MKNKKQAAALSAWGMLCVKAVGNVWRGGGGAGESVLPLQILARIDKNLFVLEESLNR